jgi:hypothetical protein
VGATAAGAQLIAAGCAPVDIVLISNKGLIHGATQET